MSAFQDAGHRWWRQCDRCEMAKFIGNRPADPDGSWECDTCLGVGQRADELRAEGYAQAREQAADDFDNRARVMRDLAAQASGEKLRLERSEEAEALESEARRIRAMQPEGKKP